MTGQALCDSVRPHLLSALVDLHLSHGHPFTCFLPFAELDAVVRQQQARHEDGQRLRDLLAIVTQSWPGLALPLGFSLSS